MPKFKMMVTADGYQNVVHVEPSLVAYMRPSQQYGAGATDLYFGGGSYVSVLGFIEDIRSELETNE